MANDLSEAERLYTKVFFNLVTRWSDTTEFRQMAGLVEGDTLQKIGQSNRRLVLSWFVDPEYRDLIPDPAAMIDTLGGIDAIAKGITDRQLGNFRDSVDQAAIVFMHSTVDAAASDLCRVTALVAPDEWKRFLDAKRVTLADATAMKPEDLLRSLLESHLTELDRESLLVRADRLFAVCQPDSGFEGVAGFKYDRARIELIDRARHDVVHGTPDLARIRPVADSLKYLLDAGLHLFTMVNRRFNVKLNALYTLPDAMRDTILRLRAEDTGNAE